MPGESHDPVPQLLVERLALGDLTPERAAQVRARLADEPGGLERLAQLQASDAEILAQHPARLVAAEVQRRAQVTAAERREARRLWLAIPALALAGLAVWLVRPTPLVQEPAARLEQGDRVKGLPPRVVLYRKVGPRIEKLAGGAPVRQGELVQPGYVAAGHRFGALFSVDGRGGLTVHVPEPGQAQGLLQPDGERLSTQAYELDDAPEYERFLLVTADVPLAMETILASAHRLLASGQGRTGRLDLPDTEQTSLLLVKVPR